MLFLVVIRKADCSIILLETVTNARHVSSVNPFLTVDHRLGKADGGTNDHKAKYYELLLLLS